MEKVSVIVLLLACVASAYGQNYNPVCPRKLKSANARTKCYTKVVKALFHVVSSSDPRNPAAAANIMMPWLNDQIVGRTTAGSFTGTALNAEYLAVFTATLGLVGRTVAEPIFTAFSTSSFGRVAMAEGNMLVTDARQGLEANFTIRITIKFDKYNKMEAYDAEFRFLLPFLAHFGQLPDDPVVAAANNRGTSAFVCNATLSYCSGSLQQYTDMTSCLAFMSTIPYIIKTGEINSNCILCRAIHAILLPFEPALHCPHVGPTGGGACTTLPYSQYGTAFKGTPFVAPNFQ